MGGKEEEEGEGLPQVWRVVDPRAPIVGQDVSMREWVGGWVGGWVMFV